MGLLAAVAFFAAAAVLTARRPSERRKHGTENPWRG